jgi:hypothetical protein
LQKVPGKHLKNIAKYTQHIDKTLATCVKRMQHPDKHTYNIGMKKQMKHTKQKACNIHVQLLQQEKWIWISAGGGCPPPPPSAREGRRLAAITTVEEEERESLQNP